MNSFLFSFLFHLDKINFFLIYPSSFSLFLYSYFIEHSFFKIYPPIPCNSFLTLPLLYFSSVSFYLKESSLEFFKQPRSNILV